MSEMDIATGVKAELAGNILPFWRQRTIDPSGGFIAEMDALGQVTPTASLGLILHARLLWTFSAVYRWSHDQRDLSLARRAYETLQQQFRDVDHGGYFWRLSVSRQPLRDVKKIYGQAFCIYALSEYHLATGDESARDAAVAVCQLIEQHARDPIHGGYFEVCHADWTLAKDERLSDADQAAPKSMNTHLHVLEAYTNLCRVWPNAQVHDHLSELLEIFAAHILNRDKTHMHHFFTEQWSPISDTYTYGHDIEASWLLSEAAELLQDSQRVEQVARMAIGLARATLHEGIDHDGGLYNEGCRGQPTDRSKIWWVQAEAVVGFLNTFYLTDDKLFLRAAEQVWRFIQQYVVDREHGEWHWRIHADGRPDLTLPKVSIWKGPYHNSRMCLEVLRRTGDHAILEDGS